MSKIRQKRVNELLLGFLGEQLARSRDDVLSRITLTGVDVSGDLSVARVFWSTAESHDVAGDYQEFHSRDESSKIEVYRKALTAATRDLKRGIAEELDLRIVPELRFERDQSAREGARIDYLLQEIKKTSVE
ncbi:MAG: 30S ribosome-binding factor RbfA [bacterium]|nr:30S ribosome-binding factor RbfA [bacterium]